MTVPGSPTVSTARTSGQPPECPMHGLSMVVKRNRQDSSMFWARPSYPHCKVTTDWAAWDIHDREQDMTMPVVTGPSDSQRQTEETARRIATDAEYMRIRGMEEELRMQREQFEQRENDLHQQQEQFQQQTAMAQQQIAFAHTQVTEQYHANQQAHAEVMQQQQVTAQAAAMVQQQAASVAAAQEAAAQANIAPVALDFGVLSPHNRDLLHRSSEAGAWTAPENPEL